MVLAIATGRGPTSLAHLARERFPLLQDTDVLLTGVRDALPAEAAVLVKSRVTILPPDRLIGAGGEAAFLGALGRLAPRTRDVVLHLDASVFEPEQFPVAAGTPSRGGLSLDRLKKLVGELSTWNSDGTIRIVGVSVTGIDARKDPGGVRMHELAGFVIRLFGRPGSSSV
jgi:arginase family enzyme